jgi:hydroxymethylglutaryl-CoA reductase
MAGAMGDEIDTVAKILVERKTVRIDAAQDLLSELRR